MEAFVEQPAGHPSEDVADGSPEEQPGQGRVATARVLADLVAGHRAGEDEEKAESLDEEHGLSGPLGG